MDETPAPASTRAPTSPPIPSAPGADDELAVEAATAMTRGIVFRSVSRVVGARQCAAWRLELTEAGNPIADTLAPGTSATAWLPTEQLIALMKSELPNQLSVDEFALKLGHATVRATFRRFFPASAATLNPPATLGALAVIWPRYHSWGKIETVQRADGPWIVRLRETPRSTGICRWVRGMLEQIVKLSGAENVEVAHTRCESLGHPACEFEVGWTLRVVED